jgi:hypothetical protein
LLALVPGLNFVVGFVLGARGNELAWRQRHFHGVDQFLAIQTAWRNGAFAAMAITLAFVIMTLFTIGS